MRIFHISDLHIGLQLLDHDLTADQRHVLAQIVAHAKEEQPDAILMAGDIYNKAAPAPEAVALFDWFMDELNAAVPNAAIMVIAGNHDDALRIDMYGDILARQHIYLVGTPPRSPEDHIKNVVLSDEHGKVAFWLLPFLTPARVQGVFGEAEDDKPRFTYEDAIRGLIERENIDATGRNVIVSHQFYVGAGTNPEDVEHMDSENLRVGGLGAVGADVLSVFDYAALGHLHKPMCVGTDCIRYCGTPMQYSVSEAGQEKGIVVVDMGAKGDISTRVIPLEPLHQIRKMEGGLEDLLSQACDDYVSVMVEGAQDIPSVEVRDRIRAAFPNLLTYNRATTAADVADLEGEDQVDVATPFDMCMRFLGDATEEQKKMLRKVIEEVAEAQDEAD